MTDVATMTRWIDALDPALTSQVSVRPTATGAAVEVQRSISVDAARADWLSPDDRRTPSEVLALVADAMARTYPLVKSSVTDHGTTVSVTFAAPVFADDLSQQAFLSTVSAVVRSAEAFDAAQAMRREEKAAADRARADAARAADGALAAAGVADGGREPPAWGSQG